MLLFQPGTPNPIAGLSVVDLEEAINGNPNSVELQPPQDLLRRYYVSLYLKYCYNIVIVLLTFAFIKL
jgi:hypothetical protein